MKSYLLIVLFSLCSTHSFDLTAVDEEEAKAIAEMKAQEAAMAEAQKKTAVVAPVIEKPQVQVQAPVQVAAPVAPVVPVNNLTNFYRSLASNHLGSSKLVYFPRPNYRMRYSFFERLGAPKGMLVKCPIPEHELHLLDEGMMGIVMENPRKHADMPQLAGLSLEARDYVQSLTLREKLRIHMYTYGYVVYEDNGNVLTVEIKD